MAESEVLEASAEGKVSVWESHYLRIIRDKTASFMGACCRTGALTASGSAAECRALAEYGEQLGMAFQIMDDVLDVVGDPLEMGKDVGMDIASGKFTLPVILALRRLDRDQRARLADLLNQETLGAGEALEVARLAVGCGAVDEARETAYAYARRALGFLEHIPASDYAGALASLARYVVLRQA